MNVELKKNGIEINGKKHVLLCASFFYFRIPPKEWEKRAKLIASLGYNCVDVYFPWNFHEVEPENFSFSDDRDVESFLRICSQNNLYVVARPGPYICSEWDGGSLPPWITANYEIRQNDKNYLNEVAKWFKNILPIISEYQLGAGKGGSVILMQLENELDFFDCYDVDGYMSNLKDLAIKNGITVPLFACAGQGDVKRSGGLVEGIVPTYNFYPQPSDKTFDYRLSKYSRYIQNKELPLLISETDRKHNILKRELLSGAKLLGAYNQVGGTNFAYYQSVNNWGAPLSLICTLYDDDAMIDNLGNCTKEADEALLFSKMLNVYGEELAEGLFTEMEVPIGFEHNAVEFTNALTLPQDKGKLICVRSVNAENIRTYGQFKDKKFELNIASYEALALPLNIKHNGYEIIFSNNEIFSLDPLVFIERSKPFVLIKNNGNVIEITCNGTFEGIEVNFISKDEAISKVKEERNLSVTYCKAEQKRKIEDCLVGPFINTNAFKKAESSLFVANNIWYGEVEYKIESSSKKLLLKGVADFLTVKNDETTVFSELCGYDDIFVDASQEVHAFVEKWGHSNFDDARKKSLRIKTERGIEKIYKVVSQEELTKWRFTEANGVSPDFKIEKSDTDPYISINSWNTTHEPLYALYYQEFIPTKQSGEEMFLYLDGLEAECNVSINGEHIFKFTSGSKSVNITEKVNFGAKNLIELFVRKANWAQKVGNLFVLKVAVCEFEIRKVEHLDAYNSPLKPAKLPLKLAKGNMYAVCIENENLTCTYGFISGSGFRATVMQDKKVIARLVAKSDKIVQAGCRDSSKFLIPSGKSDKLYFFIEAMDDGEFQFETCENR